MNWHSEGSNELNFSLQNLGNWNRNISPHHVKRDCIVSNAHPSVIYFTTINDIKQLPSA